MKNIYLIIAFVVSTAILSCGDKTETAPKDVGPTVEVKVNNVTTESNSFLTASGKIEAVQSANLSTRMMGYVNKVHVKVGDKVRKDQLLLSINNAELSAKSAQVNAGITEATAAYRIAEKDYTRFKNLFEDNSASQKELDDMTARYEMAKARLEGAKQMEKEVGSQFSYVNIRAPFSGIITNKFIDEGTMANPGVPLIAMEAPGLFEVTASVPESEISQIESGSKVKIVVKSINELIQGEVTEVSTSARNTGGQYLVKVTLDKSNVAVLSGMYATVQFPVIRKTESTAILVPMDAIISKGQLSGLYTVSESNTALLRWLRLGRSFGDQVEVLSGLSAEESYIVSAKGKLYNGVKVSIQ
jgi:RND family efflux transporter MFP subunit